MIRSFSRFITFHSVSSFNTNAKHTYWSLWKELMHLTANDLPVLRYTSNSVVAGLPTPPDRGPFIKEVTGHYLTLSWIPTKRAPPRYPQVSYVIEIRELPEKEWTLVSDYCLVTYQLLPWISRKTANFFLLSLLLASLDYCEWTTCPQYSVISSILARLQHSGTSL